MATRLAATMPTTEPVLKPLEGLLELVADVVGADAVSVIPPSVAEANEKEV
jgi:hypothetical protein